jgi:hypothetical protein
MLRAAVVVAGAVVCAAPAASAASAPAHPPAWPDTADLGLEDMTGSLRWASGRGATFDLSAMTLTAPNYYRVQDIRNANLFYYFNIGGEGGRPRPAGPGPPGVCAAAPAAAAPRGTARPAPPSGARPSATAGGRGPQASTGGGVACDSPRRPRHGVPR